MTRTLVRSIIGRKDGGTFDPIAFTKSVAKLYKRKETKFVTKKTFSPSSIVYGNGKCPRYWFIAFTGADFKTNIDAKSGAYMLNGTYVHDRLQTLMLEGGLVKETEREVKYSDPPIRGFIDLVVDNFGEEVLGEIKSSRHDAFEEISTSNTPKIYHLIQLLIYMYVTETKEGFVMYEDKDEQHICTIPVILNDRTKKIVEDIFDWMREVRKAWEDDKMPAPVYAKTSYACKGCPVFDTCWGDTRVDVKIEALRIE
jgi:CRISPR/Cas system-associated exonuclease Cas4 (RecB family)